MREHRRPWWGQCEVLGHMRVVTLGKCSLCEPKPRRSLIDQAWLERASIPARWTYMIGVDA